jgi:hypothetical protein
MDYTPVACSPKKYRRTTTAAHELAAAITFSSGIVHYADKPEFFDSLPADVITLFRDAPARWDETKCLLGEPGRATVFARRTGKTWVIAGLNGTSAPLPLDLDLTSFNTFTKRYAITEGKNASLQVIATRLPNADHWQHMVPPRGGFLLRLEKSEREIGN